MFSTDSCEERAMHSKNDNKEMTINDKKRSYVGTFSISSF